MLHTLHWRMASTIIINEKIHNLRSVVAAASRLSIVLGKRLIKQPARPLNKQIQEQTVPDENVHQRATHQQRLRTATSISYISGTWYISMYLGRPQFYLECSIISYPTRCTTGRTHGGHRVLCIRLLLKEPFSEFCR